MSTAAPLRMPLAIAEQRAKLLLDVVAGYVDRVEIAGSIRRRFPTCGDVDLVAIAKTETVRDLMNTPISTRNFLHHRLLSWSGQNSDRVTWLVGAKNPEGQIYRLNIAAKGNPYHTVLDVNLATPATWGAVLLCRTGSSEHNIWLAERAQARGHKYSGAHGLRLSTGEIICDPEQRIYAALDLPFIHPHLRHDLAYLRTL